MDQRDRRQILKACNALKEAASQRCGMCMHYRGKVGGTCLVYGTSVYAGEHHVTHRSAITGEDCGCENFFTPEADEEWCRALERAELCPVPWR